MGANGNDLKLSYAAQQIIPYSFECKARKSAIGIYDWIEQAKAGGKLEPVVVFKADRKPPLVMLHFDHFMELIKNAKAT